MGVASKSITPPSSQTTQEFFRSPSPALSLSLAGIFRDGAKAAAAAAEVAAENMDIEGDEASVGGGGSSRCRREETVEISSENSGALRSSRSDDDHFFEYPDEGEDDDGDDREDSADENGEGKRKKKKKKKTYHRHTSQQITVMEKLFKECPHPDEQQRQQLSKQLGLHPRQVKFWFQNRRTQIKQQQGRHENELLRAELDKAREENKALREALSKGCCPNCNFALAQEIEEEEPLRAENARLKSELEKMRNAVGRMTSDTGDQRSQLDLYNGIFGLKKSTAMELVSQGLEELKFMAVAGEPMWVRSLETGREILNYDEYKKMFPFKNLISLYGKGRYLEASRETGIVFADLPGLVESFLDANQWQSMFPSIISKAATVNIVSMGEGPMKNGVAQLMFAELQMLTPMVPTREVYFVRHAKQLSHEKWAIVDVSLDKIEITVDVAQIKCRKRGSGCIIEDQMNGHCKVTWLENIELQESTVHPLFRPLVNSGLAFGANRWFAALQQSCERLMFAVATNVPLKDSSGVSNLAGKKSTLELANRMTESFCRAIGASSLNAWSKVPNKFGDDVRVSTRKNVNDPGEPLGVILCASTSVWLPVSPHLVFDFLRDHKRRNEWDVMANGSPVQSIVNIAKGQDRGNAVSIQTMMNNSLWVLQDSCTNSHESMVVYAAVDSVGMEPVMTGSGSSNINLLASGFSILPDGVESRHLISTSQLDHKSTGGSLLTFAFQILAIKLHSPQPSGESVELVNSLISGTLQKIRASLNCPDN